MINKLVYESLKIKPWRNRAELFILTKDSKLVVGHVKNNNWEGYVIPGGGIDNNEKPELAAKREALEELGVKVNNLKLLDVKKIKYYDYPSMAPNAKKYIENYSGAIFHTFVGNFAGYDKSKWGKFDDSYNVKMINIDEAKEFFKKHALKCKSNGDKYNYEKAEYVLKILSKL
jgi:8-oxo-dGTP pyrophosphatase MutT (NUDIX family)